MASNQPTPKTNSRETLYAILASAAIAIVLGSLLTGNPLRVLGAGYGDYSHETPPADVKPGTTTPAATPPAPAPK